MFRPLRWTPLVNAPLFVTLATLLTLLTGCTLGNTRLSGARPADLSPPLEVVGYLPAGKIATLDPAQVRHLTDLVYFSLSATPSGNLASRGLTTRHLEFLHQVKRDYGVRLLLGITEHKPNGPLAKVAASPVLRERFAANVAAFLKDKGFDGADFDWEYPSAAQMPGYEDLLARLKERFSADGLRLSVAVSPWRPLSAAGYLAVDRVHGMMYDDAGKHATFVRLVSHAESMIAQGVDPAKLQLGIPFYGRGYTTKGPKWSQAVSYRDLQSRYQLSPTQDTVSGFYFNGIETIQQKVRYAQTAGLAGVMVWEIGQDTTDESSLLNAISQARSSLASPSRNAEGSLSKL